MAQIREWALVAGGAGFLGSHLVDRLLTMGYKVLVVDNLMTGDVANLPKSPNVKVVVADVSEQNIMMLVDDALPHAEFKYVFNFACPASPPKYQKDPIHTMMTCVMGTMNLLDFAQGVNARFIHASTSEVYGDPSVHPQIEEYRGNVNPIGPRACYDEGKRAAEAICYDYVRRGADVRVARIFNTYGPRMDPYDGRVVTNFIRQALANEDITVYGDGSQTRSLCYVDDLIDGIISMTLDTSDAATGPINLGNPWEMTVLDLAKLIITMTGSESKIVHKELPVDDPTKRQPDILRAKTLLGWEPKVTLEDGLQRTIQHMYLSSTR